MKRIIAILMAFCLTIGCSSLTAFAGDSNISVVDDGISVANIDYYTFSDNSILDGYATISVTPGSGEALKIHTYIMSGSLKVQVKKSSALFYTTITTWSSNGHHYADLVSNTDGSTYYVRLYGVAAWFSGGIYSE